MSTEWRDVPGFEGRYQVSNDGQVMSYARPQPRLMKLPLDHKGYERVLLSLNGKKSLGSVHRLMALAFLPDSWFPGAVVCHNDGDKRNNTLENLRWATVRENNLDLIRHGRHNWQENFGKTHCIRGHEFAGSNLRISAEGKRKCRACHAIHRRNYRIRKRLRKLAAQ